MRIHAATHRVHRRSLQTLGAASLLMLAMTWWVGSVKAAEILIGGTGAAIGTMQALGAEYSRLNPKASVKVLPSLGSGGGVKALLAGKISIAVTSRPLTEAERGKNLKETEIARTPIVIVTGVKNKVSNLTFSELAALYSGKTAAWPDGTPVRPILRPADDIDTVVLKTISPEVADAVVAAGKRPGMNIASTDTASADELERVPGAFGTSSLSIIVTEKRALKVITLNGVVPMVRTLEDKSYPYHKAIHLVTHESVPPDVAAFLKFVRSPAGESILNIAGNLASAVR